MSYLINDVSYTFEALTRSVHPPYYPYYPSIVNEERTGHLGEREHVLSTFARIHRDDKWYDVLCRQSWKDENPKDAQINALTRMHILVHRVRELYQINPDFESESGIQVSEKDRLIALGI